jgi:alpha-L-rhamnosidase
MNHSRAARVPGLALLAVAAALGGASRGTAGDELAAAFREPPDSARPAVWWHWMNDSVTREGISADLGAMKAAGLGEAQVFNAGLSNGDTRTFIPHPAPYLSPDWFALERFALAEAARLGIALSFNTGPGVTESGAPWMTPEEGMQHLVWSEIRVPGGMPISGRLPLPPVHYGFLQGTPAPGPRGRWVVPEPADFARHYRDVALLAFPTPPGDLVVPRPVRVSQSGTPLRPTPSGPAWVEFDYERPVIIRSVQVLCAEPTMYADASLECREANQPWRKVAALEEYSTNSWDRFAPCTTSVPETRATQFRLVIRRVRGAPEKGVVLALARLGSGERIAHWEAKAAFIPAPATASDAAAALHPIAPASIIDLTALLQPDGTLQWAPPPGEDWTILRIGHSPMGLPNGGAMAEGTGYEADKLDRRAVAHYLQGGAARIVDAAGAAAGPVLRGLVMDSWESFAGNWTPSFAAEFGRRRGYDPRPWLPAMTGRVIGDRVQSERFLFDVRRTIAELVAENHYRTIGDFARSHALRFYAEAPGHCTPTVADCIACKAALDVPMGEFWRGNSFDWIDAKQAVAAAQVYGKPVAATESFTSVPEYADWRESPADMKALGDRYFALGVNLFILHTFVHQPWLDRVPGMTLGPYGSHFERTNGWLGVAGRAWTDYLARCQFMLRRGKPVVDVLYFVGEDVPNDLPDPTMPGHFPLLPRGHDFGAISPDGLLGRLGAQPGKLVLPDGMIYRILVLPDDGVLTLATARKIRDLVAAGATVLGPRPRHSPSLADGPLADRELSRIADQVWGRETGIAAGSHPFGKGRVAWGSSLDSLLPAPDFDVPPGSARDRLVYAHRGGPGEDIYFVSNQGKVQVNTPVSFRVGGRVPERWDPEDGSIHSLTGLPSGDGRTALSLRLPPEGSVFIVFRGVATAGSQSDPAGRADLMPVSGPWGLALPGDASPVRTPLGSWTDSADARVRYFSGTAVYTTEVDVPAGRLPPGTRAVLDLGRVGTFARVSVNGRALRVLWHSPYRIDVSGLLRPGSNRLEIAVTNLLVNRLIGDSRLPAQGRSTWSLHEPYRPDSPLLPSGLLGPVRLELTQPSTSSAGARGFDHREDVLERRAGLDVMAGAADVARLPRTQGAKAVTDLGAHLLGCPAGKDRLVVHAAVEDHAVAELLLEFAHVHSRAGMLDRVEDIHPAVEDRLQKGPRRAVGVVEHLEAVGVDELAPAREPGLEVPPPLLGGDQQRLLACDVVAHKGKVEGPAGALEESAHHLGLDRLDPVQGRLHQLLILDQVEHGLLQPAHLAVNLKEPHPGAHDREVPRGLRGERHRLVVLEPARIGPVGIVGERCRRVVALERRAGELAVTRLPGVDLAKRRAPCCPGSARLVSGRRLAPEPEARARLVVHEIPDDLVHPERAIDRKVVLDAEVPAQVRPDLPRVPDVDRKPVDGTPFQDRADSFLGSHVFAVHPSPGPARRQAAFCILLA